LDAVPSEDDQEPLLKPYLLAALNELPAQRFKAFNLVHMEDKKYHEAAKEMGISVNSLKSHLKLAVKFLRMRLQR
jgi:RNA polymerase sigma-70 factor (ECF subfamily)